MKGAAEGAGEGRRGEERRVIIVTLLKCGRRCAESPCSCTLLYYFLVAVNGLEHSAW